MQSKTSFFNKALFKKNISRTWIPGLIYFIILALCMPVAFVISNAHSADDYMAQMGYTMEMRLYQHMSIMPSAAFAIVISIVVTSITFWYLFNKRDNYMMHAFPVNRKSLFFTGLISSLIVELVPVLLAAVFMTVAAVGMGTASVSCIWYWTFVTVASTILFSSIAMFALMTTGQIVTGILFYIIFNFLYILMEVAFRITASVLMFGLRQSMSGINYKMWTPVLYIPANCNIYSNIITDDYGEKVISFTHSFNGAKYLFIYLAVAVVIYAISFVMYKTKKLETVQDFIAVPFIKPIFSVGMSFFISMVGGAAAAAMSEVLVPFSFNTRYVVSIWIMLVIGIIIYYATQMMIEKTLRVFSAKTLAHCAVYSVAAIIVMLGLRFDVMNIENKVPDVKDIKWVGIDNQYIMTFRDKESIEQIRELHQNIIDDKKELRDLTTLYPNNGISTMTIKYQLKNGDVVIRSYDVIDTQAKEASATYVAATQPILDFLNQPKIIKEHIIGNIWKTGYIKDMTFSTYTYDEDLKDFVYDAKTFDGISEVDRRAKFGRVYKALLKDIDEGKVFVQRFGYDMYDDEYNNNNLYNDFYFTIRDDNNTYISDMEMYWGDDYMNEMFEQEISVSLSKDCKHTLKALKEEEFYDSDELIITYDEYNERVSY